MPYNPQVSAIPLGGQTPMAGQYYANAINSVGNSVADGLNRWYQNDRQDTLTRSQVAGLLPTVGDAVQNPEDKSLIEKFVNHKTDYKDNGYLLGILTTLKDQKQQALQNQYLQAQTSDVASQAATRAVQSRIAQGNYSFLQSLLNGGGQPQPQPQGGGLNQPLPPPQMQGQPMNQPMSRPAPQPGMMAPAPRMAPQPQPQAQAPVDTFSPTSPAPQIRDSTLELARGTGQMPDPTQVVAYHKAKMDQWGNVERPLGYVEGSTHTDKDGNKVTDYYPTTIQNNGTIKQSKEPVTMYWGNRPPGTLLDSQTYKPAAIQAPTSAVGTSAPPAPTPPNKETQDAMAEAAQQLTNLTVQRKKLDNLQQMSNALAAAPYRSDRLAPIQGSGPGNVVQNYLGDPSGIMFNASAAPLYSDIMSNIKGLRTQMEFTKVTGGVPDSSQPTPVRNEQIAAVKDAMDASIAKYGRALDLMKKGATAGSAWAAVSSDTATPVHRVFANQQAAEQAAKDGDLKSGTRVTIAGVSGTWK